MNIIILEDDNSKLSRIKEGITTLLGEVHFDVYHSRNSFLQEVKVCNVMFNEDTYLILDMHFPIYDNDAPKKDMGLYVLQYLDRRNINVKTIICSSDKYNKEDIPFKNVIGCVHYDSSIYTPSLFFEYFSNNCTNCGSKPDFEYKRGDITIHCSDSNCKYHEAKESLRTWNDKNKKEKKTTIKRAICTGSYDPFTYGHLDIIKQASYMFDEVHVVIATNINKKRSFNKDLMENAIKETLLQHNITNCIVCCYEGLIAEYCATNDIEFTVRGLRNNMDYNYEENISEVNALLNPNLKSVYVRATQIGISSSMVRELFNYHKDISKFVPKPILNIML